MGFLVTIGHRPVYIDEIQEEFNASISGIGANVDAVRNNSTKRY